MTLMIRRSILLFLMVAAILVAPASIHAQAESCPFGSLEVPLPGFEGLTICQMLEMQCGLGPWLRVLANLLTAVVVGTGLLAVVAGGYVYMTAGGSGARINLAKTIIGGALLGIILALTGYLILRTISPQFVEFEGLDCSGSIEDTPQPNPTTGFIPSSPAVSPSASPFATQLRLSYGPSSHFPELPPKVQSRTGPIYIDLGETIYIGAERLLPHNIWRRYDPTSNISYHSYNPSVIEIVESPPDREPRDPRNDQIDRTVLGKSIGTTNLSLTIEGHTITTTVHVRDGCYGITAGGWVPIPTGTAPTRISELCSDAGYSARIQCTRYCPDLPLDQGIAFVDWLEGTDWPDDNGIEGYYEDGIYHGTDFQDLYRPANYVNGCGPNPPTLNPADGSAVPEGIERQAIFCLNPGQAWQSVPNPPRPLPD